MTTNFRPLSNLSHFSLTTKQANEQRSNERLPFYQIQLFIDRCCPSKAILKKVALKLDHIIFHKDIWSTIVRYKNTFDRFHFYASFIVKEKSPNYIEVPSTNHQFDFHIEGSDSSHPQGRFVHIYSLPFGFDKLHGFSSCSELSSRCSFSSVRHLYFTEVRLDCLISFESLAKHMPHLTSIDCIVTFTHDHGFSVGNVAVDHDIFNHVECLRFICHCFYRDCVCHNLLTRLLNRMPHLKSLTTSEDAFLNGDHPLPPIKRLVRSRCDSEYANVLVKRLPHLSMLSLGHLAVYPGELSQLAGSLFIGIPSLRLISFGFGSWCGNDKRPYGKYIEQALALLQNMDGRLRHMRLDFGCGVATFHLHMS